MAKRKPMETDLLTAEQVAAYLQVHKLTIYKYIRDGRLPAVRLGRTFRVSRDDVQHFLHAQRVSRPVSEAQEGSRRGRRPTEEPPRAPSGTGRRGASRSVPRIMPKHSDEIYVGPVREEHGRPREDVVTRNPLDWVIRGLH